MHNLTKWYLFLIISVCLCFNANAQNISVLDLFQIVNKNNWESVNTLLTNKGWEYYDSKAGDDDNYNTVTWTYEKNNYNDKAQGWFKLYTYTGFPNKASFQFRNKSTYNSLKNSLAGGGFKYVDTDIKDDEVISKYTNPYFIVFLSYIQMKENEESYYDNNTHTSYLITVIKKAGVYDDDNGLKKTYYNNGSIESEYILKDGKINGIVKVYWENGNIKFESNFLNGDKNGISKEYDEYGNLKGEFTYKSGKLNGQYKLWDTGKLKLVGNCVNDIKTGNFKEYNEDEQVLKEYTLKEDNYDGKYFEYRYRDNKLRIKTSGSFINGEKNGVWQTVKLNEGKSDILFLKTYVNGSLEGDFKGISGDSIIFCKYVNNEIQGDYKVFTNVASMLTGEMTGDTSNAVMIVDGRYLNGKKTGHWKYYSVTTVLIKEGDYFNDNMTGEWKYYYDNITIDSKSTPFSKQLYLVQTYENGLKNGRARQFSTFTRQPLLCDTIKYKNSNPIDTCYEMVFKKMNISCFFKNGLLHGPFEERDDIKGTIIQKGNYIEGEQDGEWIETIDDDGQKYILQLNYKNGKVDGKIVYKDTLNKVFKIGAFSNGERNGNWKDYFTDGSLKNDYNYQNGSLVGEYKNYKEDGTINEVSEYAYGELKKISIYDPLGSDIVRTYEILSSGFGSYKCRKTVYGDTIVSQIYNLTKDGNEKIYGNYFELYFYLNINNKNGGYADGEYREYNKKNIPLIEGNYYKDIKIGKWTYYYPDIQVKIEQEYINNIGQIEYFYDTNKNEVFSGKFILRKVNGEKICDFKIDEGLRDGKSKYYDSKGETIITEKYEKGILKTD